MVLITGGTGFLGSSLALRHRDRGDEVVVVAKEATPLEASNARELRARGVDVACCSPATTGAPSVAPPSTRRDVPPRRAGREPQLRRRSRSL